MAIFEEARLRERQKVRTPTHLSPIRRHRAGPPDDVSKSSGTTLAVSCMTLGDLLM